MIKFNKEIFKKALVAGFFSAFTIGVLTILTFKSTIGLFLAGSFGSSMVLLFGFPESPFAQPRNVFFGHLITAMVGVIFVNLIPLSVNSFSVFPVHATSGSVYATDGIVRASNPDFSPLITSAATLPS